MKANVVSLDNMQAGESGKVFKFEGGERFYKKLDSLGIRKGKKIKKVSDMVLRGPITIQIENSCTVAIGRGMAKKIMVRVD